VAVATRGWVPCPRCGSSDAVLRAAEIPPGQHIEFETVTTTGTRVRGLEPEPVLVTSEHVERRDISVNVEPYAFPTRFVMTVWLLPGEFPVVMMDVYELWSPDMVYRVLAILLSVLGAGMLALYVRGWLDVWSLSRVREQLLSTVLPYHRKAWICARCDCLFFEAGEAPHGIEPLTAIHRRLYRERLWKASGYRKYARPGPGEW
jgi:hypothetical protein